MTRRSVLIESLESTPRDLARLLRPLDAAAARWRPAADEWCIADVVAHLGYCEAPYLDRDADKANDRYHLTARQAGLLARMAHVRELVVFHFSPRYTGQEDLLYREAKEEFAGTGDRR